VRHHHAQGLSARALGVDELFHPGTLQRCGDLTRWLRPTPAAGRATLATRAMRYDLGLERVLEVSAALCRPHSHEAGRARGVRGIRAFGDAATSWSMRAIASAGVPLRANG